MTRYPDTRFTLKVVHLTPRLCSEASPNFGPVAWAGIKPELRFRVLINLKKKKKNSLGEGQICAHEASPIAYKHTVAAGSMSGEY